MYQLLRLSQAQFQRLCGNTRAATPANFALSHEASVLLTKLRLDRKWSIRHRIVCTTIHHT